MKVVFIAIIGSEFQGFFSPKMTMNDNYILRSSLKFYFENTKNGYQRIKTNYNLKKLL